MNGQACAVTRKHIMITGHIAPRKFTGEEKENKKKKISRTNNCYLTNSKNAELLKKMNSPILAF